MMIIKKMMVALFLVLGTQMVFSQNQPALFDSLQIIAPGAQLQKISDQFSFTEGPVPDKKGNIYFTDQPNNKIWKFDTQGNLSVFLEEAGRSNGLEMDRQGNIIACADEKNELWSINPRKKIKVLLNNIGGLKMNGPNDLWIDALGGIYFTDPYYQRNYWTRQQPELRQQNVYYLAKGQKQPITVADDFVKPNGIVGSANGDLLYVTDIGDQKTYSYLIQQNGRLSNKQLIAPQGSDGLTLDSRGNLYLTGKGVTVYNPQGIKIAFIPVPENWTANICFGGKDRDLLFLTAGKSIYILKMNVKGNRKP